MAMNKEYNVSDFLAENVKQERTTKEIKITGYKKPFVIQSVTSEEFDQMQKQATRKLINKKTYQEIENTLIISNYYFIFFIKFFLYFLPSFPINTQFLIISC